MLGEPGLRRLALTSFFFSSTPLCLVTYLVTCLTSGLGYTLVQARLMLWLAQAAGVVARVGWGARADRTGKPLAVPAGIAAGMGAGALAITYFGVLVAPPLFGVAGAQRGGFALPFALLALPALASAIGLWRWHRGGRREAASHLQESP